MEISQTLALPDGGQKNGFAFYINNGMPAVAAGPLADAMASALDQIYRREVDPITGIVLENRSVAAESQQLDQLKRQSWIVLRQKLAEQNHVDHSGAAVLYGVHADTIAPSDLINVAEVIGTLTPEERAESAVIVEGTMEPVSPVVKAMESFCAEHNLRVYRSFSEFVKS